MRSTIELNDAKMYLEQSGFYRRLEVVACSDHLAFRKLTRLQLTDWMDGRNTPSILDDFEGWWLATSIKYRLPSLKLYLIDWDQFDKISWRQTFEAQLFPAPRNYFAKYQTA